jgi:hypothetical protein
LPPFRRIGFDGVQAGECPEWQRELTVNQPSYDFEGSSPSSPTNYLNIKEGFPRPRAAGRRGEARRPRSPLTGDGEVKQRIGAYGINSDSAADLVFNDSKRPYLHAYQLNQRRPFAGTRAGNLKFFAKIS